MGQLKALLTITCAVAALAAPGAARAQRTQENVTTQSGDAFGRSVGNEKSGLYNNEDVRGFNPVDAGNVRLEGLYFDQLDRISSRLNEGNTIRVGLSARHFPFPAPTGLVDYRVSAPGGESHVTVVADSGSTLSLGPGGSVEFKLALDGRKLGLTLAYGGREMHNPDGSRGRVRTNAVVLAVRPETDMELLLFAGEQRIHDDETRPTLYPAGIALPPRIERFKDLTQPWADRNSESLLVGGVVRSPLGPFRLESGLFWARRAQHSNFADLLFGVAPDGSVAQRVVVADGNNLDTSLSGETRLAWAFRTGAVDHQLTLGVRARAKNRRFGGSQRLDLGPSTLLVRDERVRPDFALGLKNVDRVRQVTPGIAYSLSWRDRATLDASLARSAYRKRVDFADPALADLATHDHPAMWNLSASYQILRGVTLYAGAAHGMEEALIAPDIAINRSESPPAIHTRQIEAGVRIALAAKLALVAGAFSISKPYYNLDPASRYRQLGELTNRGIELSLTGEIVPGLTLVGGTLLLDPKISGEAVASGLIGPRPVGQVRRRSVANLDYRPDGGTSAWSFDLAVESYSSRIANSANTLAAPPRASVNLGARYRFGLGGHSLLLRPLVMNLFDNYGWQVSPSGGFTYVQGRAATIQLIADL